MLRVLCSVVLKEGEGGQAMARKCRRMHAADGGGGSRSSG